MIRASGDPVAADARNSATVHAKFALHLKAAGRIFDDGEFVRLLGEPESGDASSFAPLVETERIARDFLRRGGRRFRPFVALAAYHALHADGNVALSDEVKRVVLAIEAFHKASLVHDDIEDDDLYRYGCHTLHRQHDTPTAINVGDYLIGLGYRLITEDRYALGSDRASDILHRLMDAHVKLAQGQGAEIAWRRAKEKGLRSADALHVYALKTSPAFEAALYTGVRLAGDASSFESTIVQFSHHLGVAFQIINDLDDWSGDSNNKLVAQQDMAAMRPTVLLALALEAGDTSARREIESRLAEESRSDAGAELRRLFQSLGVFKQAERLLVEHRRRAIEATTLAPHDGFRHLLRYLVDAVLEPSSN